MSAGIINFYSENQFQLKEEQRHLEWLKEVVFSESKKLGEIDFIFCDDAFLLEINQKFLNHDTYTDIISFDNSLGKTLNGEIYISTERVLENSEDFEVPFIEELRRVMVHGVLHLCGHKDSSEEQKSEMRQKENEKMKMFHVEQ